LKRKTRLLCLTFICLSSYLPLIGYSLSEVDFPIRDIKIASKDLENLKHEGELISYHDVLFADTLHLQYYDALTVLQGKKQKHKLGVIPLLYYPAYEGEVDVHTRATYPQISNLPHICVFQTSVLLRRRKINRVEVYLHNRRLLASDLILAPRFAPFIDNGIYYYDVLLDKNPQVQLSHIYSSEKPYPKFKMQRMWLQDIFDYHLATMCYSPLEYIPNQKKLYVYDMRIVIHYENELIPFYEDKYNRLRRSSLVQPNIDPDFYDEKNVDPSSFNYGHESYPGFEKLMLDEYEIPTSELDKH